MKPVITVPPTGECCHREAGAGTALMACIAMAALLLLAVVVLFAQASVAASRAATAADLSALAAADAARGLRDGTPCPVAAAVALHHGARLTGCSIEGESGHIVQVHTEVDSIPALPPAAGQARAGPPTAQLDPPPARARLPHQPTKP